MPGRGKYGDVVEDGVVKPGVLTRARSTSLSSRAAQRLPGVPCPRAAPMYEHGLATLGLAEMYGMDPDPELEDELRKAVDLIVKCPVAGRRLALQPRPGGPGPERVSVMQIVALRAANNAEIPVPEQTLREGDQVRAGVANPAGRASATPGRARGRRPAPPASCRCSCSASTTTPDPETLLAYLGTIPVQWGGGRPTYFYYFHYYAIQAHYQAGGKEWNDWHPRVRELLLEKQNKDGSWDVPPGAAEAAVVRADNKTYATAMATLVLNIYHALPARVPAVEGGGMNAG